MWTTSIYYGVSEHIFFCFQENIFKKKEFYFQLARNDQEKGENQTSTAFINSLTDFVIKSKGEVLKIFEPFHIRDHP